MQLRNATQFDALAELVPQKSGRMIEACGRCRNLFGASEKCEKYFRVSIVGGDLDVGQGHHADARVFDLESKQIRQFALDLFRDAQRAGIVARHRKFSFKSNVLSCGFRPRLAIGLTRDSQSATLSCRHSVLATSTTS